MFPASGLCFPVSSETMSTLFHEDVFHRAPKPHTWKYLLFPLRDPCCPNANFSCADFFNGLLVSWANFLVNTLLYKSVGICCSKTTSNITQIPWPWLKIPVSRSTTQWNHWELQSHKDPISECHFILSLLGTVAWPLLVITASSYNKKKTCCKTLCHLRRLYVGCPDARVNTTDTKI